MPDDPIRELLSEIEVQSARYGVGATDLSTRLEEVERRLSVLPGKIEVMVEANGAELRFTRVAPDEWGLVYVVDSEQSWTLLTDLPVSRKIEAGELVAPLLVELRAQLHRANESIGRIDRQQGEEA